jgi:phosphatidylglycerophosphatase A
VAGYLVTMALVPWSLGTAVAGFLLFRLFDVLKPWPASAFDRVKSGFGVVMDDVAAGVWAWGVLELLRLGLRILAGCSASHWWCLGLGP